MVLGQGGVMYCNNCGCYCSDRLRLLKEPYHLQPFSVASIFSLRRLRRGQLSLEPRGPSQQAEPVEGPLEIYEELDIVFESEPL
eukprot:587100-Heterocapsa_arctica.AAC.1